MLCFIFIIGQQGRRLPVYLSTEPWVVFGSLCNENVLFSTHSRTTKGQRLFCSNVISVVYPNPPNASEHLEFFDGRIQGHLKLRNDSVIHCRFFNYCYCSFCILWRWKNRIVLIVLYYSTLSTIIVLLQYFIILLLLVD